MLPRMQEGRQGAQAAAAIRCAEAGCPADHRVEDGDLGLPRGDRVGRVARCQG